MQLPDVVERDADGKATRIWAQTVTYTVEWQSRTATYTEHRTVTLAGLGDAGSPAGASGTQCEDRQVVQHWRRQVMNVHIDFYEPLEEGHSVWFWVGVGLVAVAVVATAGAVAYGVAAASAAAAAADAAAVAGVDAAMAATASAAAAGVSTEVIAATAPLIAADVAANTAAAATAAAGTYTTISSTCVGVAATAGVGAGATFQALPEGKMKRGALLGSLDAAPQAGPWVHDHDDPYTVVRPWYPC
jgi:hypothetical protein